MKNIRIIVITFLIAALNVSGLGAQAMNSGSVKGMSLNGSTGLFSIPSARIGWENSTEFNLDLGFHTIVHSGKAAHIPKLSASLLNWVELNAALDFQPDGYFSFDKGTDFIVGAKVQFPMANTAIALGGNFQALNFNNTDYRHNAGQLYMAVSYAGQFFDMPAETTVVAGKTFGENYSNSNIDFGMGFDLLLLPKYFGNFIHWITDFANFSYSVEAFGADAWHRGVLNTGFRINLSAVPIFERYKFAVDILMTDAFDQNRAFSVVTVFGMSLM